MDRVHEITERLIKPLCDATKRVLKPLNLSPEDRLQLSLDDDGKRFIATTFAMKHKIKHQLAGHWRSQGVILETKAEKVFPSYEAGTHWWGRFPERKRLEGHANYILSGTDFTAIIIHSLWPENQIILDDEAKILYNYLLQRFCHQNQGAAKRAAYKILGTHVNGRYIDHPKLPLAQYQKVGLDGSIYQEAAALFMEQGTGKTPITIARICNEALNHKGEAMYRVLIVAPKNVRSNWRTEFERFSTTPGKVTILRGGAIDRVKHLIEGLAFDGESKWTAIIISYETLLRSWDAIKRVPWDLGVLDESHYIKNPQSKRAKRCMELREVCKSRMALTGTPISNSVMDLFSQLEWLGEGLSGFSNFGNFRSYYGNFVRQGRFDVLTGYKNMPLLQERLARLSFMITKAEALPDLPKKLESIIEVSMSEEQAEIYRQVAYHLYVECQADLKEEGKNRSMTINNVLIKLLRLAQITCGYVTWDATYSDDGEEITPKTIDRFDPDPKLEALVELIKNRGSCDKTVIWVCWIANIKTISARLKLDGVDCVTYYGATSDEDRDEAVRRFNNDPICTVFIGNPAAGGTGLNLLGYDKENIDDPMNCNQVIYYSQNWSMVHRSQSEDRSHRMGTRVPIQYIDLVVPGSIDEEIRYRVLQKRQVALVIQDVRDIMIRVLESIPSKGDV